MPMTPGYYMNSAGNFYYNPANPMTTPILQPQMQQSYAPASSIQQGIIWVDGEVGAKAFQMPSGWPAGTPIPLWDTNDTVIYLKSINQMGMPNPLQKIHYTMEDQPQQLLPAGQSSGTESAASNMVTKDELQKQLDDLKREMREMLTNNHLLNSNQNGGQKR